MKVVMELLYISKLNDSKIFGIGGGTLSDAEKICGVTQKSKDFRRWLREKIEEGLFEQNGYKVVKGNNIELFRINRKNVRGYFRPKDDYVKIRKITRDDDANF